MTRSEDYCFDQLDNIPRQGGSKYVFDPSPHFDEKMPAAGKEFENPVFEDFGHSHAHCSILTNQANKVAQSGHRCHNLKAIIVYKFREHSGSLYYRMWFHFVISILISFCLILRGHAQPTVLSGAPSIADMAQAQAQMAHPNYYISGKNSNFFLQI